MTVSDFYCAPSFKDIKSPISLRYMFDYSYIVTAGSGFVGEPALASFSLLTSSLSSGLYNESDIVVQEGDLHRSSEGGVDS